MDRIGASAGLTMAEGSYQLLRATTLLLQDAVKKQVPVKRLATIFPAYLFAVRKAFDQASQKTPFDTNGFISSVSDYLAQNVK